MSDNAEHVSGGTVVNCKSFSGSCLDRPSCRGCRIYELLKERQAATSFIPDTKEEISNYLLTQLGLGEKDVDDVFQMFSEYHSSKIENE